ncbi:glycoside hydrolase [Longimycelium tulufanense]|uniref:Glycoside hydrolase n=1 Tax=Longimycelium tulufanense TaxID=907463 RepID=A0A8J3FXQ3_9PSEU|nr:GH25 family lysozyme [Longimycelium tulufanense]GGM64687.1 glycoside hydrolase [Longimycelium tulufanense]
MDYGIDISSWQGTSINWGAVRDHNISFTSVKVTEGTGYVNPCADAQVAGARSVGIAVGGYHYAHPGSVTVQVDHFVAQLDARRLLGSGSLWPMLDMEESGFGDPNPFISEFIRLFRERTGRPLLVYANLSWFTARLRPDEWVGDNALWLALYNGDPANTEGYAHPRLALHQHTSQGNVNGFPGFVDRNVTVGGWSVGQLVLDGTAPTPVPEPPPAPRPVGWVDYRVQPGDTLSGIAAARRASWQELQRVNGIPNADLIYAGQVIRVPAGGQGGERYQIRPGDTLWALAQRWGTTVDVIASRNGIANPDFIRAGDWLTRP